jgi:hypothetical protein
MSLALSAATLPEWITAIATALGFPVAAVALILAGRQLGGQREEAEGQRRAAEGQQRASQAQFLLALDDAFRQHDPTHRKFRPPQAGLAQGDPDGVVGLWHGARARGPSTAEEWADVEAYMGLFERVNAMIDRGLLDVDMVQRLHGYRISNIVSNPRVVEQKLLRLAGGWQDFLALARRLKRWPSALEDVVKLRSPFNEWPAETQGLVVGADPECARVKVADLQGANPVLRIPHKDLTAEPRRKTAQGVSASAKRG